MQNFKLTLEYDGTHYQGFQIQNNGNTIQAEVEKALKKLFHQKIRIISCGRTDSGVHAKGHVINFKVDTKIKNGNILRALNRYLPKDIAVKKVQRVPFEFHAQYNAKSKIYEYQITQAKIRSPLRKRYIYEHPYSLNISKMKKVLKAFEGRHDFRAFASKTVQEKNTVRIMKQAKLFQRGNLIKIRLEANGFLYNMVRNIVGTLLLVGEEKISESDLKKIFRSKNRSKAGAVAPPQGLTLVSVKY